MSDEKNRAEAARWMQTAAGDLASAEVLAENARWAHACFHAQQAGEKALKALWYHLGEDPWGHSVKNLIDELAQVRPEVFAHIRALQETAARLDRYYVPTRYPNGLPELTPESAYFRSDADEALDGAGRLMRAVKELLG